MGAADGSVRGREAYLFFALACAITWACDVPYAIHVTRRTTAPEWTMALVALGAFGPTLAAVIVAARSRAPGAVRSVFRPFWGSPLWILAGLATVPLLHLVATLLEVALGGTPHAWFYPPVRPEHVAALFIFSFGEEFGWRGFAHARVVEKHGPVAGSLLLGLVWGLWHLVMWLCEKPDPSVIDYARSCVELLFGALIFAWVFERGGRRTSVAVALHMGAHLDSPSREGSDEPRLVILRLVVLAAAAAFAAWALRREYRRSPP